MELIDSIAADPQLLSSEEARSTLIEAALSVGDAARAKELLPEPDGTPESRLLHATVTLLDGGDRSEIAAELDSMIEAVDPGELRNRAVVMRLLAADDPAVSLDPSIAADLDDGDRLIAQTRAAREIAAGNLPEARAAVAGFDDLATLALRAEIAERDDALPEAIGLQAALTRGERSAENLLRLAGLRARTRDFPGAIRDALRLDDR